MHEPELRRLGVVSLSLFGSVARGESDAHSDIDIAVRIDPAIASGGFEYFGHLEDLRQRLSEILGSDVDVITEPVRKPRLRRDLEQDRILAFA